ncbi:MAG: methanol dehydrogenase, partial [Burkholderiales bacterium]|nr:methanol dehydrogenase [Burkholderiales bacterium]
WEIAEVLLRIGFSGGFGGSGNDRFSGGGGDFGGGGASGDW